MTLQESAEKKERRELKAKLVEEPTEGNANNVKGQGPGYRGEERCFKSAFYSPKQEGKGRG
jgi:hypothetical protein